MEYHRRTILYTILIAVAAVSGCNDGPAVTPVSGKVLYNGEPLPYGNVVFQPPKGQPAGAAIQPDGSFRLSTFDEFDGAIVGHHKVSVSCYASQSPSERAKKTAGEATLGAPLIPSSYSFFDQSGLTADVPPEGADSVVLELTGPKRAFPK